MYSWYTKIVHFLLLKILYLGFKVDIWEACSGKCHPCLPSYGPEKEESSQEGRVVVVGLQLLMLAGAAWSLL